MTEKKGFSCKLGSVNTSAVTLLHPSGTVSIPLEQIQSVYVSRDRSLFRKVAATFILVLALLLLALYIVQIAVPWFATISVAVALLGLALLLAHWLGGYTMIIESEKRKNKLTLKKKSKRIGELFATAISTSWEESAPADWGFLRNIDELAHYSVIVGYVNHFKQQANVLDVGCGEGLLEEKLRISGYKSYLGFDLDTRMIEVAQDKQNEHTSFKTDNIETFETNTQFDAIVFNEVLYYAADPIATFKRYISYLSSNGIIVVSMFEDPQSNDTWKLIDSTYKAFDNVQITNGKGTSWQVKCYCPN